MKLLDLHTTLYQVIKNGLENSKELKNYRVFHKVKDDDKCLGDYIIYSLDGNLIKVNTCNEFKAIMTLRLVFVSNFKSSFTNIELINFVLEAINCDFELEINTIDYTDSIVSEPCTNLVTDLRVSFNPKILKVGEDC